MFGVLNLHKPDGVTSRDVVNVVQRRIRPVKTGHAGTLDPMATGVLLVCVGKATKLISLLQQSPKTYEADFDFGVRSDTDDSTGEIEEVAITTQPPDESILQQVISDFVGTIEQVPPAYSAVKVDGRRAYTKARRGDSFELRAKQVSVHSIDLIRFEWPRATFRIVCGSGTYIRSIARDMGKSLGCGGLMSRLVRTQIGQFSLDHAVSPDRIETDGVAPHLVSPTEIVSDLPHFRCSEHDVKLIATGRAVTVSSAALTDEIRNSGAAQVAILTSDGSQLLALGEFDSRQQTIQPRTVFLET